jgi:uncharacterized protein (DUF1499 family)
MVTYGGWNDSGTRPNNLGLKDYGTFKSLGLCPPTPNCISTAEEANDVSHFVPAWTYNVPGKPKKTKAQAVAELKEVVLSCTEGKFTPTIVKSTENYVNAEFQSSFFGVRALCRTVAAARWCLTPLSALPQSCGPWFPRPTFISSS